MKKFGFLLVIAMVFMATFAVAQPSTTPSKSDSVAGSQVLTPQEAQQMRDAVKALGNLFDVNDGQKSQAGSTTQSQQGQQTTQPQQKSMADVADKALDLTAKGISYIAQNIEKSAPWVWRVMMRQQYANAISYLIVPWSFLILTLIYAWVIRTHVKYEDSKNINYDGEDGWKFAFRSVLPVLFGIIFSWWGICRLSDSIQILMNPEYYAIKNLLQIILHPSSL